MKIEKPPWCENAELAKLFSLFSEHSLRLVGGAVRQVVRGSPFTDIDLATSLKPDAVMALLADAGINVVPTGLAHGTVTAFLDAASFEITSLRRDIKTDGRHAVVEFTEDWRLDAERRDFTLNALYADLCGQIFDPLGCGIIDAKAGRVRFVGNPAQRLQEDHLRGLRYFRFLGLCETAPEAADLAAVLSDKANLAKLSGERVWSELAKILALPKPLLVLQLLQQHDYLCAILPPLADLSRLTALMAREDLISERSALRRLAALMPTSGAGGFFDAAAIAKRLKFSAAMEKRLKRLLGVDFDWQKPLPHLLYQHGAEAVVDALLLDGHPNWQQNYANALAYQRPIFPLMGADLLALGLAPSPKVGQILAELEAWWIAENFSPTRDECLAELARCFDGVKH